MIKANKGEVEMTGSEVTLVAEVVTIMKALTGMLKKENQTEDEVYNEIITTIGEARDAMKKFDKPKEDEALEIQAEMDEIIKTPPSLGSLKKMVKLLERLDELK